MEACKIVLESKSCRIVICCLAAEENSPTSVGHGLSWWRAGMYET